MNSILLWRDSMLAALALLALAIASADQAVCYFALTPSGFPTISGCNSENDYRYLRTGNCRSTTWRAVLPSCASGIDGIIRIEYSSDEFLGRDTNDSMRVAIDGEVRATVFNTGCYPDRCNQTVGWASSNSELTVESLSSRHASHMHMRVHAMGLEYLTFTEAISTTTTTIQDIFTPTTFSLKEIMPSVVLQGVMTMEIDSAQARNFTEDPLVLKGLEQFIATMMEVHISWVHSVSCELEPRRSLLSGVAEESSVRSLVEIVHVESVYVSWKISIPPDSPNNITATILTDRANRMSVSDAATTIRTLIDAGVFGNPYEVSVKWLYLEVEQDQQQELGPVAEQGSDAVPWIIFSSSVSLSVLACCILVRFVCTRNRRRKKYKVATTRNEFLRLGGPFAHRQVADLLQPPSSISESDAANIRKLARTMLDYDDEDVQVLLTYATGHRAEDDRGCGPGLYFAAAVLQMLYEKGIKCLCDLMFSDDMPHGILAARLASRSYKYQVLLVLQTKALYECGRSLKEIFTAQEQNLQLIPIRCEDELPSKNDQWPDVSVGDFDDVLMVTAVQAKFGNFNSIPSPPYTISEKPFVLNDLCVDLHRKLGMTSCGSQARNSGTCSTLFNMSSSSGDWLSTASCNPETSYLLKLETDCTRPSDSQRPSGETGRQIGKGLDHEKEMTSSVLSAFSMSSELSAVRRPEKSRSSGPKGRARRRKDVDIAHKTTRDKQIAYCSRHDDNEWSRRGEGEDVASKSLPVMRPTATQRHQREARKARRQEAIRRGDDVASKSLPVMRPTTTQRHQREAKMARGHEDSRSSRDEAATASRNVRKMERDKVNHNTEQSHPGHDFWANDDSA